MTFSAFPATTTLPNSIFWRELMTVLTVDLFYTLKFAPFTDGVLGIVYLCPYEKMVWVAAGWIIAMMANSQWTLEVEP